MADEIRVPGRGATRSLPQPSGVTFEIDHEDDQFDLRPSMGIIFGVLLSLPFWAVAVWLTWLMLR